MSKKNLNSSDNYFDSIPFNTAFGPRVSTSVISNFEESITDQEQAHGADINVIVARILRDPEHLIQMQRAAQARFGDETLSPQTYQEAHEIVRSAKSSFDALPAAARNEFQNDPVNLLKALSDPNAQDRLTRAGILRKPLPPEQPSEKVSKGSAKSPKDSSED